jgi:hypothetical protein
LRAYWRSVPHLVEGLKRRVELVGHNIDSGLVADPEIGSGRRGLAEQAFEVKPRVLKLWRLVGDQFRVGRIENFNSCPLVFDFSEEPGLTSAHQFRDTRDEDRMATRAGCIDAFDNPLRPANFDANAGGGD